MKNYIIVTLALTSLVVAGCGADLPTPPGPQVTGVSPVLGSRLGGTEIIIKGQNFTPETTLTLAEKAVVDLTYVDAETMTGKAPPAAGGTQGGFIVSNEFGLHALLDAFFYIPAPKLTGVDPGVSAPEGGDTVTLTGKGFVGFDAGPNTVFFGLAQGTNVQTLSDTVIKVTAPPGLGQTDVSVTNNNGTATKVRAYKYYPPPRVTSVDPGMGTPLGGTSVAVRGSGFVINEPGPNRVYFGGVLATNIVVVDDDTITCDTPPSASGTVNVSVENANGIGMLPASFLYYPKPTLTAASPDTGGAEGGDMITLTGTGFVDNAAGTNTVHFDGNLATNVSVLNDTTLTCTMPSVTTVGIINITVSNANGTATLVGGFESVQPPTLYGVQRGTNSVLYTINTSNASGSVIGSIGAPIDSITISPTFQMYGTTINYGGTGSSTLYRIDTKTAQGTSIGSVGVGIWDLTFIDDRLVGITGTGQALEIDTGSASTTNLAGGFGTTNWVTSTFPTVRCGFTSNGGSTCWYMPYASSLYQINPDSGSNSFLGSLSGLHSVRTMGYLQGTLYIGHVSCCGQNQGQGNAGNVQLYSVNTSGPSPSFIGTLPSNISGLCGNKP